MFHNNIDHFIWISSHLRLINSSIMCFLHLCVGSNSLCTLWLNIAIFQSGRLWWILNCWHRKFTSFKMAYLAVSDEIVNVVIANTECVWLWKKSRLHSSRPTVSYHCRLTFGPDCQKLCLFHQLSLNLLCFLQPSNFLSVNRPKTRFLFCSFTERFL